MYGKLEEEIPFQNYNNIDYLGVFSKTESLSVISKYDFVFCLDTSEAGCPNVLVEAFSLNKPVIAPKYGSYIELIGENCDRGMFINENHLLNIPSKEDYNKKINSINKFSIKNFTLLSFEKKLINSL
jgi:glycosyltransferase involved in cell wall biosynthesis